MKTIIQKLTEMELKEDMPVAELEDWFFGVSEFLGTISEYVAKNKWNLIKTFDRKLFGTDFDLEFRQLNNNLDFVLGYFSLNETYTNTPMERFVVVMRLDCTRISTLERYFNVKKLIKVNQVALLDDLQGIGIVSTIYKYLVNDLGYSMLSDGTQFNGARKLWSRLSNEVEQVTVDVVDVDLKTVIKASAQLNHGLNPEQYNRDYWSEDNSKENIRFLLKQIK